MICHFLSQKLEFCSSAQAIHMIINAFQKIDSSFFYFLCSYLLPCSCLEQGWKLINRLGLNIGIASERSVLSFDNDDRFIYNENQNNIYVYIYIYNIE